jgi:hypothetical protein
MSLKAKSPPDTVGSVLGRIASLRTQAHVQAAGGIHLLANDTSKPIPHSRRELPNDYEKRLAQALKDLDPEFKALDRRLKKCYRTPEMGTSTLKATALAVLGGAESEGPLSREGALTKGVAESPKAVTPNILDFLQGID